MVTPQFDPANPEHVHNALRELNAHVNAFDIAKKELIEQNTEQAGQLHFL